MLANDRPSGPDWCWRYYQLQHHYYRQLDPREVRAQPGDFYAPDVRVVSERVPVQSKHCLIRRSLQLEPLGVYVTRFEIDLAIMELENRDVAVSIDGNIVWMRWHERIYHHSVETAIDLLGDDTEDDLRQMSAFKQQLTECQ